MRIFEDEEGELALFCRLAPFVWFAALCMMFGCALQSWLALPGGTSWQACREYGAWRTELLCERLVRKRRVRKREELLYLP